MQKRSSAAYSSRVLVYKPINNDCARASKALFRPDFEPFPSLRAWRPTSRCVVSSPCLTLLASPDSAGGGLNRARVVPRRGVLSSFFFLQTNCFDISSVYLYDVDTYQSSLSRNICERWVVQQVALFPFIRSRVWVPESPCAFSFGSCATSSHLFWFGTMFCAVSQPIGPWT